MPEQDTDNMSWKASRAKVKDTPFQTASDLNAAERAIELETWTRIRAYKAFSKELSQAENREVKRDFEVGFVCKYSGKKDTKGKV